MYAILVEYPSGEWEYVKDGADGDEIALFPSQSKAAEIAEFFLGSGEIASAEVVSVN